MFGVAAETVHDVSNRALRHSDSKRRTDQLYRAFSSDLLCGLEVSHANRVSWPFPEALEEAYQKPSLDLSGAVDRSSDFL